MSNFSKSGIIYDCFLNRIYSGTIHVENGVVVRIVEEEVYSDQIITHGFVDSHVHIESSLLSPPEYARLAVRFGVIGAIADPHEIANVLGKSGVEYMIESGNQSPFNFYWGASPCVPATTFETAGAKLSVSDVQELLLRSEVTHLAEVMNFPGVLSGDSDLMAMIEFAKKVKKPIDAHAPGLMGDDAIRYIQALGNPADHECFSIEEARGKNAAGGLIAIREGSAAKNFNALWPLLLEYPESVMFCADDAHPDYISLGYGKSNDNFGYIDSMVRRAILNGVSPLVAFSAASKNPMLHYGLPLGRLRVGDPADFIIIESLETMKVTETYIGGQLVQRNGECLIPSQRASIINNFSCEELEEESLKVTGDSRKSLRVIEVLPGQLITNELLVVPEMRGSEIVSSPSRDIAKLVVYNRYMKAAPAIAFVNGMGLKFGAMASSVAHDSHNVVAVGMNDNDLLEAINLVVREKGGLSLVNNGESRILPLPIAGLMSDLDAFEVAKIYSDLDRSSKEELGCCVPSPFMTLSFLALLVIPSLKLSDKGLFDGDSFNFVPLQN